MSLSTTAYILAASTSAGGIMGYVRTGSVPSIAAGLAVGSLYGIGGYRLQNRQPYGIEIALLASLVLAGSSLPRAIRSGGTKPVPVALSLVALFGLVRFATVYTSGGSTVGTVRRD